MSPDRSIRRVVVAPDKFKGSLSAEEVADILIDVLQASTSGLDVTRHPIADGGEGTVAAAVAAGFTPVTVEVTGPLGDPVEAVLAVRDEVAVLELAAAAGLALLPGPPDVATASAADTRGVGELVGAALDRGARRIVLGVGGSASTDGGAGLVRGLGVRVLDGSGVDVPPGGAGLTRAVALDRPGLDPRVADVEIVVACDVDNPLLGEHGAAAVYGPQKGADAAAVQRLDGALSRWADLVTATTGVDHRDTPGVGAAGGAAFGAVAVLGARLAPGVETVAGLTGLDAALVDADLVIVGEGSLDAQSLRGKGPIGVAARATGVAVIAVVGRNLLSEQQWRAAGLSAVYALTDLEPRGEVAMRDAAALLTALAGTVARDWCQVQ